MGSFFQKLHSARGFVGNPQKIADHIAVGNSPKRKRIDGLHATGLIAVALFFDGLHIILTLYVIGVFINWIISALAWGFFTVWFKFFIEPPVSFLDRGGRIAVTTFASLIIGFIPPLNILPEITVAIAAIILFVRLDDAKRNLARGKITASQP